MQTQIPEVWVGAGGRVVTLTVARDCERPAALHGDTAIARDVVDALEADIRVPDDRVQAIVKDGCVTLVGLVDWNFQRMAAAARAMRVAGIRGLVNNITVHAAISPSEVRARIEAAIRGEGGTAARIGVSAVNETVHLFGEAGSWFEREAAEKAAAEAPGVLKVVNHLSIGRPETSVR